MSRQLSPETGRPEDERLMRLAIALGRRNLGRTWPNPSVGAVLVDPGSGRILASGVTAPGGRPHGEPIAIAAAGAAARGATLYVSLEPCSHHGRTPPCADAIVAAGIGRVVSALSDPDPRVAGSGHARLRGAGIPVRTDVLAGEAARAHRGHMIRVREGRPALTVKLARTADGLAGSMPGAARLIISGEGAQARTHLLRAQADAVLVGIGTLLADDPRLDVRLPGLEARSPARIVVDTHLRCPPGSRLVATAGERRTVVLCGPDAPAAAERALAESGVAVLRAAAGRGGRLDLRSAVASLAGLGLTSILCEGGPHLADALAEAGLVDEIILMTSARSTGGPGIAAVGDALAGALRRFAPVRSEIVGPDTIATYERRACSPAS